MTAKKELLDEILKLTGGLYISDLREYSMYKLILNVIDNVEKGAYSDREWQNAFSYITGNTVRGKTEGEVRNLFKHANLTQKTR